MKKFSLNRSILLAVAGLAAICLLACSNTTAGTSDDPNQITASIKGVVEKGPFVKGTTVTLYELNPETFAQTGKVFTGSVDGDDGSFSLGKVELGSRYALVEASGYYWNELYGMKTTNPLSLKAVVHIEKNSTININVGTHITHKRILSLVESGMDFDKAKAKAESEVVEAFFGENTGLSFDDASIFDDDMLLALSIIVLMSGPEPDVTETIANLASGVTPELLLKLADKAAFRYAEYAYARNNMEKLFPDATIGHFEKFIYIFWQRAYGLGECSKERAGALDTVHAENSVNDGKPVICKEVILGSEMYVWRIASDVEENTAYLEPMEDGKLVISEVDSSVAYVYDNGAWRNANGGEVSVGRGCVKSLKDSIVEKDGYAYKCDWIYCIETVNGYRSDGTLVMPDSMGFVCQHPGREPLWTKASILDYEKESFFNAELKYGTVTDERDDHVYKTVEIDGNVWMAENLALLAADADCSNTKKLGCVYSWRVAMVFTAKDTVESGVVYRGLCMEGWHIPDTTEWNSLLEKHDVNSLKSVPGWKGSTNETGFSAVPTLPTSTPSYVGYVAANSGMYPESGLSVAPSGPYGYAFVIDSVSAYVKSMTQFSKYEAGFFQASVRCVKDSE